MKVIIAGGRDFNQQTYLNNAVEALRLDVTEVVSGKQKTWDKDLGISYGADYQGEQWAFSKGIPVKPFPADWDKYGRSAGPRRNQQMADYADCLVAFWDGKSSGTKSMIQKMKALRKPCFTFYY